MKIHHLRNATLVIEVGDKFILVDPMLGEAGTIMPFTFFRFKAIKNPIVQLPHNSQTILEKVTHCLITHPHPDHIDQAGKKFLRERNIPVICSEADAGDYHTKGLNVTQKLKYWKSQQFLGGTITGIPARHGYGFISAFMGNVMGFHLSLPRSPSIYISADTIYTVDVESVLATFKPDVAVVACGSAQLDIGKPLLMRMDDIIKFVKKSPGRVIANHLESLNHCPTTRTQLREHLKQEGLLDKVLIPDDGETILV